MIALNTGQGGFKDKLKVLPTTSYNELLNAASVNPKSQYFEKRVLGIYLGDLLQLILLDGLQSGSAYFGMKVNQDSTLYIPSNIDSLFLSAIVADDSDELGAAREIIAKTLSAKNLSLTDAKAIQILTLLGDWAQGGETICRRYGGCHHPFTASEHGNK